MTCIHKNSVKYIPMRTSVLRDSKLYVKNLVMINLNYYKVKVLLNCWRTMMSGTLIRQKSSGGHPTAGIIVIGDEIIKAQVKDTNCFYACKQLYKHGVKVQKICVVRDDLEDIVKEIKEFSKMFDYVFTSGGIGPTHDDITYEAVALAFNDTLHYHPMLVDVIKNCFNYRTLPSAAYKMAYIPTKSVLKFGRNESTGQALVYPCVVMQNVYLFPGSPVFFETSFQSLCKEFFSGCKSFKTVELYINAKEEFFADILSAVAQKCPSVSFGSYPERSRYYKTRVTIESENMVDTVTARNMLCDRIPVNTLVHYDRTPHIDCLSKYETMIEKCQRRSVYEDSFKKFVNYYEKPEEVWIYLDDSDESVLMIHLARTVNNKLHQYSNKKLYAICLLSNDLKLSTNKFLYELCERYNIELCELGYEKSETAQAIKNLIVLRPKLRILLVGKRMNGTKREIYSNLERLNDDPSVPVQVHFPLVNWMDKDVEEFFRFLSLPYHLVAT